VDRLHPDTNADSMDDIDKPTEQSLRQALMVLGPHRSGTSAVTGVLNLLGAELGQSLMPGDIDNERGYWENVAFVKRNDVLLRAFDICWDAPVQMPPRWNERAVAERMATILRRRVKREFGQAQMVAVKDPRLCRLAPLWMQVLEDVGYRPVHLLVVRHPREVAASLERRNGFPLEKSYLLWLQYFFDAEAATRGKPRIIVDYATLLRDWRGCVGSIGQALGVQWPKAIDSVAAQIMEFLEPALRHHNYPGGQDFQRRDGLVFVDRIYEDLVRAGGMGTAERLPRREEVDTDYLHLVEIVLAQSNRDHAEASLQMRRLEHRLQEEDRLTAVAEQTERISAELMLWNARFQVRERDTCKLYWREDGFPYREELTKTCAYGLGDHEIKFAAEFPPGTAPDFVRIDPSEWPGLFALDCFEFGGEAVADPGALLSMVHGHRIGDEPGTIRFAGFGADPHVELDLRRLPQAAKARDRCRRFAFRVSCIGMQSEIATLARRAGTLEAAMAAQQSDAAKIRGGIEVLSISQDQHAEILDGMVERLGPALSSLDTLHDKMEAHMQVADSALHGLAARLESVQSGLDALHKQVESQAQVMNSVWPEVVNRLNSALSGLDRLYGHVEAQQQASTVDRAELRTRIDTLFAEQRTISLWAKRRSPSYWWRRWRRI
jgi:hypothetical protein